MTDHVQISLPADSEGFISRKCEACSKVFQIHLDDSDKPLTHCPYCNAEGDTWLTDEQQKYVEAVGFAHVQDLVGKQLDDMARDFNRSTSRGGLISMKLTHKPSPKQAVPPPPVESPSAMPVFTFACCNEPVKHDGSAERLFCIICGAAATS